MSIADTLSRTFSGVLSDPALSDDQIRETQNPMELTVQHSLVDVVPCYMLYCIKHPDDDSLVALHTVGALAEYGRAKDPSNAYLNFKFQCNADQREAVVSFLLWAKGPPHFEDEIQIDRAVRNWRKALDE